MRFFRIFDEQRARYIRTERRKESEFAHRFRIGSTAVVFVVWGVLWLITGNWATPFLTLVILILFYWVWYQIIPRINGEWKFQKEGKELDFATLLYKYVDAKALEDLLEKLSKRVARLEESKQAE